MHELPMLMWSVRIRVAAWPVGLCASGVFPGQLPSPACRRKSLSFRDEKIFRLDGASVYASS